MSSRPATTSYLASKQDMGKLMEKIDLTLNKVNDISSVVAEMKLAYDNYHKIIDNEEDHRFTHSDSQSQIGNRPTNEDGEVHDDRTEYFNCIDGTQSQPVGPDIHDDIAKGITRVLQEGLSVKNNYKRNTKDRVTGPGRRSARATQRFLGKPKFQ